MTTPDVRIERNGPVAGAVLTGGASRRMGRDKALVEVEGVAMVRRVADSIAARGCRPVVAIGGDAPGLAAVGLLTIPDRWPGLGPLGGILTALDWSQELSLRDSASDSSPPCVLVVATDLPWLDAATVDSLLAHRTCTDVDVVVARSDRLEPLCALWWPSSAPLLADRFAAGARAVHRVIAELRHVEVGVAAAALVNVNSPSDLA